MELLVLLTVATLAVGAADTETDIVIYTEGYLEGPTSYNATERLVYNVTANHTASKLQMNVTLLNLKQFDTLLIMDGMNVLKSLHAGDQSIAEELTWFSSADRVNVIFYPGHSANVTSIPFNVTFYELIYGGLYREKGDITSNITTSLTRPLYYQMQAKESSVVSFMLNMTQTSMVPSSQITCYDGQSQMDPVVGFYKSDFVADYPAISTQKYLFCVAENISTSFSGNFASVSAPASAVEFSMGASDFYTVKLSNQTATWRILPEFHDDNTVVQLSISMMSLPTCGKSSVLIYNFHHTTIADLSKNEEQFIVRGPAKEGFVLESNATTNDKSQTNCYLYIEASYTLDQLVVEVDEKESSGYIETPNYPHGTPADLMKTWKISIPESKSAALLFDENFNLDDNSRLVIDSDALNMTYLNIGGSQVSPDNVYITNNQTNTSLVFTVTVTAVSALPPTSMSKSTGFRFRYTTVDKTEVMNYTSSTPEIPTLSVPNVTVASNKSYYAVWKIQVPRDNSKGNLNVINMNIGFMNEENVSSLVVYDGGRDDSPVIYKTGAKPSSLLTADILTSINSTANIISIMYQINNTRANETQGDNFTVAFDVLGCVVCKVAVSDTDNKTMEACIKSAWRCDGQYQCVDGLDEKNCKAAPTTKPPPVTKEGARWWVVAVVAVAAFVIGIIATIIGAVCIAKRRGSYTRLRDMMAPVPT